MSSDPEGADVTTPDAAVPDDPAWYNVRVNGAFYSPSPLNVIPGSTVTFINSGPTTAHISGDGPQGAWTTGDIAPGDQAESFFETDGDYYYSNVYESGGNDGVIVVQPLAAEPGE